MLYFFDFRTVIIISFQNAYVWLNINKFKCFNKFFVYCIYGTQNKKVLRSLMLFEAEISYPSYSKKIALAIKVQIEGQKLI